MTGPEPAAALHGLSEVALDLLTLVALAGEPVAKLGLARRASAARVRPTGRTRALSKGEVEDLMEAMLGAGVVELAAAEPERMYGLRPKAAIEVLGLSHRRGRLADLREPERAHRGDGAVNDIRLALAREDAAALTRVLNAPGAYLYRRGEQGEFWVRTMGIDPRDAWIDMLPGEDRRAYLDTLVDAGAELLMPLGDRLLDQAAAVADPGHRLELARLYILRGDPDRARSLALPKGGEEALELLEAFWTGDYDRAADVGDAAVAAMVKRKHRALPGLEGFCHVLVVLSRGGAEPAQLEHAGRLIEAGLSLRTGFPGHYRLLDRIRDGLLPHADRAQPALMEPGAEAWSWSQLWVAALHDLWLDTTRGWARDMRKRWMDRAVDLLGEWVDHAERTGHGWVARELRATADAVLGLKPAGAPALVHGFRRPEAWEAALVRLEALVSPAAPTEDADSDFEPHLMWALRLSGGEARVLPRIRASARAKKGRKTSLAKLIRDEGEVTISDADRRVLAAVEHESADEWPYKPEPVLRSRAAAALVGHPHVVDEDGVPLRVERGQPRITTTEQDGVTRVGLEPDLLRTSSVVVERAEAGAVRVYERGPELDRFADLVAQADLEVPAPGRERLGRALARLAIASELEVTGDVEVTGESIAADPRPVVALEWSGTALVIRGMVAPLGVKGPHVRCGTGAPRLLGEVDGRVMQCERDFGAETKAMDAFVIACPLLAEFEVGALHWIVPNLPDALELLLQLDACGDAIVLAWRAGRTLAIPRLVDDEQVSMRVRAGLDWLALGGEIRVDEETVLGFEELLAARAGPRFVALGRDRFLALSDRLRRRIDTLEHLGTPAKDGVRLPKAALPLLEELAADLDTVDFDEASQAQLQTLRSLAGQTPPRPRGFQADLRDYQRDGYEWLWRLAEAGLGACLADDMGLGKTVQALALLCHRAKRGPGLVVCPTSVVVNWCDEARRFAPNLDMHILADASDRQAMLDQLGPADVLVCSYGLLATEAEALGAVTFGTAVFDEAHALKNERTKRATAARKIQAPCRVGLTGTPIENHLGELWSLFRVLLPGLLGTRSHFAEHYAKPIGEGDRHRANELRAILRHFVLRRTKAQVLDELPPRTEIDVRVQPTPEERAYYEALRRRARENVATTKGGPKQSRVKVLAEIMRLRQAAVDPRLLDPEGAPAGAKFDAVLEHIDALREEGHRALVFTQFLGSIAAITQRLDAADIPHLTLDGSTPARERARRIEAFQAGEGDVFVLSLRAGGVGINLTGADYVLHVDPWWNPAVEDQATDRAHRIGQTRPVTVYRFINEGTIEEKILQLHQHKRGLADDLLAGLDEAKGLSMEELMGLLG